MDSYTQPLDSVRTSQQKNVGAADTVHAEILLNDSFSVNKNHSEPIHTMLETDSLRALVYSLLLFLVPCSFCIPRQICRQADMQSSRQAVKQSSRQAVKQAGRYAGWLAGWLAGWQAGKQAVAVCVPSLLACWLAFCLFHAWQVFSSLISCICPCMLV